MSTQTQHVLFVTDDDPEPEIEGSGFIRLQECANCNGYAVAIVQGNGNVLACHRHFPTIDEALDAARGFLKAAGVGDVHIGQGFTPGEGLPN